MVAVRMWSAAHDAAAAAVVDVVVGVHTRGPTATHQARIVAPDDAAAVSAAAAAAARGAAVPQAALALAREAGAARATALPAAHAVVTARCAVRTTGVGIAAPTAARARAGAVPTAALAAAGERAARTSLGAALAILAALGAIGTAGTGIQASATGTTRAGRRAASSPGAFAHRAARPRARRSRADRSVSPGAGAAAGTDVSAAGTQPGHHDHGNESQSARRTKQHGSSLSEMRAKPHVPPGARACVSAPRQCCQPAAPVGTTGGTARRGSAGVRASGGGMDLAWSGGHDGGREGDLA